MRGKGQFVGGKITVNNKLGGGNSNMSLCSSLPGGNDPILTNIFQMAWFNHQLEKDGEVVDGFVDGSCKYCPW